MIVAVTGSSGLLGRAIVRALADAGHRVIGIDAVPGPATAIVADLGRLGDAILALADAEAVVHAAAIPRPTGRTAADVFTTNVTLAFNAVEAAANLGIPRFLYASSFAVLGLPFNPAPVEIRYLPVDEAHAVAPQDAYALSKWLGEEIVEAAVHRGAFAAISLRLPWIQTPATFMAEVGPRRTGPDAPRDLWAYIDARDAAAAFLAALAAPLAGHLRLFLSAADTYSETPSVELARAYPRAELRRPLPGHAAVIDITAARASIGFAPRHSWRGYPAAA